MSNANASELNNLVIEIGTEEIPADALVLASDYLTKQFGAEMDAARLAHGELRVFSTPRRIIILADDVASSSTVLEQVFRGPAANKAFDEDGSPTKAALGFANSKGTTVDQLERRMEGDIEYLYAKVEQPSRPATQIIGEIVSNLIRSIPWKKSQRWGSCEEHFSRPVRWLVGLLGSEIVDFEYAGLKSGRVTYGHRFMNPDPIELLCADDLLGALEGAHVVSDPEKREQSIRSQIEQIEQETGLFADVPAGTFAEVLGLVEYPTVLVGHFDDDFLQVPSEIITDAMLSHQRYFPLYEEARAEDGGKLSSKFLVVSNGNPEYNATIIEGNERVVRARLADAAFFYHEDLKRPLADYVDDLSEMVFQEELGTMRVKVDRIVKLAGSLARQGEFDDATIERTERSAFLAKADLVTNAVVEFTSQQGVMGGYYARAAGEAPEVAIAVEQHYRPKFAGDILPDNDEGKLVAIADKLDTIAGIFAIGQPPTGSKDPFALRRGAIGIISILQTGFSVDLSSAIELALDGYEQTGLKFDRKDITQQIHEFFEGRLSVIAKNLGNDSEVVSAVLATGVIGPVEVIERCKALSEARDDNPELFEDLEIAYKRANNLRDRELGMELDRSIMGDEEKALLQAIDIAKSDVTTALESGDYPKALESLAGMRAPIDAFFTDVRIMDDDKAIRENHLRLLNRFIDVFSGVADFEKLGG